MAEINNSIALEAPAPRVNPLETIGRINSVKQGLLNNRLLGQQVQGKEALGQIIGRHTGRDGQTDWDAVSADAAMRPDAALLLPEIQKSNIDRKAAMAGLGSAEEKLSQDQLETSAKNFDTLVTVANSYRSYPGKWTKEALTEALRQDLIATGRFRNREAQEMIVGFLEAVPDGADDAAIRSRIEQAGLAGADTLEKINAKLGEMKTRNTGGAVQDYRIDPMTGKQAVLATTPLTMAPGLVDVYNPITRRMEKATTAQAEGAAQGAPTAAGGVQNGRYPGAGGGQTGGRMASGPALGEAQAANEAGTASGQDLAGLRRRVADYAPRMFQMGEAIKNLQAAPTGKGSTQIQDWRSTLDTFRVPIGAEEKGKAIAFDKARKYMMADLATRGAALGLNTDASRATLGGASPSVEIQNMAAQDLLKVMMGLARMETAQEAAFSASGLPENEAAKWSAQWSRSVDPRAFMADTIPPDKRKAMLDKMSPEEKRRFANGLLAAKSAKLW